MAPLPGKQRPFGQAVNPGRRCEAVEIDNGLQPCGVQPNRQFTDEVSYSFLHVLGELRNDVLRPIQGHKTTDYRACLFDDFEQTSQNRPVCRVHPMTSPGRILPIREASPTRSMLAVRLAGQQPGLA